MFAFTRMHAKWKLACAVGLSLVAIFFLPGCATQIVEPMPPLKKDAKWALLPFINYSQTPQAHDKVSAIAYTTLKVNGIKQLEIVPTDDNAASLIILGSNRQLQEAIDWADRRNFDYLITGFVEEWQYKAGLDGEPAVSITINFLDAKTHKVIWSATGARVGWGRESTSITARKVLIDLFEQLAVMKEEDRKAQQESTQEKNRIEREQ